MTHAEDGGDGGHRLAPVPSARAAAVCVFDGNCAPVAPDRCARHLDATWIWVHARHFEVTCKNSRPAGTIYSAESDGSCLPAERGLARGLLQGRA